MDYIMIGIGILFFILSVCIWKLKWDFLIAGYNTASKEEKKKINIEVVRKRIGIMLFLMGGVMIISGLLSKSTPWISSTAPILIIIIALASIVWINKGTRTQEDNFNKKSLMMYSLITSVPIILVLIGIFYFSTRPMEVTINKDLGSFTISGPKSETINFKDIKSIEIVNELPNDTFKVNGVGIGHVKAGSYKLENGQKVTLHLQSKNPNCLLIKMNNNKQDVYINFDDDSTLNEVYNNIKNEVK
ncbi:MAG: DUF3784 domain-containing protein [Clostridium sp.]